MGASGIDTFNSVIGKCCGPNKESGEKDLSQSQEPIKEGKQKGVINKRDLDKNLKDKGNLIKLKDYEELIPKKARNYMNSHKLEVQKYLPKEKGIQSQSPLEFGNGDIYYGSWNKNYEMEGKGELFIRKDNVLTEGVWIKGQIKFGRVFLPNGDIYEGEISNNGFEGNGKMIYSNGEIYEGDFMNGEITGQGILTFNDGTKYSGNFEKGFPNGKGNMKWVNGTEYNGDFSNFKFSGFGVLSNRQGEKYEGDFDNNVFNGKGKYTYQNGDVYEGEYESGQKKGKGKFIRSNDNVTFEGIWNNDLPNGKGEITQGSSHLQGYWRNGLSVDSTGEEEELKKIDLTIIPNNNSLDPLSLPNIVNNDFSSIQFLPGNEPSFIN